MGQLYQYSDISASRCFTVEVEDDLRRAAPLETSDTLHRTGDPYGQILLALDEGGNELNDTHPDHSGARDTRGAVART